MNDQPRRDPAPLGTFHKVPLREVWANEAASFTPWLAQKENLSILAETLGLPEMEVIETERRVGIYSADIVCKTVGLDQIVLIENQVERSDHRHLGQILTYAAGLDANLIVWVTQEFTEEHRAAIDWINEITGEEIHFFGVVIEAWKIDDSKPAPRFNIVAEPNDWSKTLREQTRQAAASPPDPVLQSFWNRLSDELRKRGSRLPIKDTPPRTGNYFFVIDSPRRVYLAAFRDITNKQIGVYLGCYEDQGRAVFERLEENRQEISQALSQSTLWTGKKDGNAYHIRTTLTDTDPLEESDWPRQISWLCDCLEDFQKVIQPYIDAMPDPDTLKAEGQALRRKFQDRTA